MRVLSDMAGRKAGGQAGRQVSTAHSTHARTHTSLDRPHLHTRTAHTPLQRMCTARYTTTTTTAKTTTCKKQHLHAEMIWDFKSYYDNTDNVLYSKK